jgi:hypothetical protein
MLRNIIQRRNLVDAVLAEFGNDPFKWGERDCGKMVIWHVRNAGFMVASDGAWTNERGLLKWIKRNGGSGAACLDGWGLERIAPARVLPGDVVEVEGSDTPVGSFGIVLGNGRVIAYHEAVQTLAVIQPAALKAAWSI